ncbi:hypothetical protein [Serratia proteamaculans]|uniref:Uncharacterized protein n=1 Tax=Serratia proteamaculans TaxID=28151 RepID=A0A5Q2VD09_SERPR|nr:hypothetical protein [Serratia proteamaculans]QGH62044.1 hypothetical protein GHV41_14965 [Serratia proteamaculans]
MNCEKNEVQAVVLKDDTWWKTNFSRLDTLKISHRDLIGPDATIYGNGKNCAPVIIDVKVLDKNNTPITLSEQELKDMIGLCNYTTGSDISMTSGWFYSKSPNDYVKPMRTSLMSEMEVSMMDDKVLAAGMTQVALYVKCDSGNMSLSASAFINIPGVGKFNSSNNPTDTPNGPVNGSGSVFRSPSYVSLKSKNNIDYSKPESINVVGAWKEYGDFSQKVTDMKVSVSGPKPDFYEGKSSVGSLRIYPKDPSSKFLVKRASGNNAGLARFTIYGRDNSSTADIVWGLGGGNYDASLVFIEAAKFGVRKGAFALTGNKSPYTWTYNVGDNDTRHYFYNSLDEKYVDVRICNHRVPRASLVKDGWSDSSDSATVYVVDDYGNDGTITLSMGDSHWPRLRINTKNDW